MVFPAKAGAAPASSATSPAKTDKPKVKKVVIAKNDFLELVRAAIMKSLEGGRNADIALSRERVNEFYKAFLKSIVERAQKGPFSVRGFGSWKVIESHSRKSDKVNHYLRARLKLRPDEDEVAPATPAAAAAPAAPAPAAPTA